MKTSDIETEVTLHVRVHYAYSQWSETRATMHDPGEPGGEEIIIEKIEVIDGGKVIGELDPSWVNKLEISAIEDHIRDDVEDDGPEYIKDED